MTEQASLVNAGLSPARTRHMRHCNTVLMVGTHLHAPGGIRAVAWGYVEGGLFRRFPGVYAHTHNEGRYLRKAWHALQGYLTIAWRLITLDQPLVHIHLSSRASFWRKSVAAMMARIFRRPYILHLHGSEFAVFYHDELGPLAQRYVRWIFENASLVLALADEWKQRVLRICPGANVEVLHNAVALPAVRAANEANPAEPIILSLGALGKRKGTYDLTRAFAKIADEFPTARLLLGGGGDLAQIRALAAELGVGKRVECLGWIGSEEKLRRYPAATVFALPSYNEGVPMAMLEAMSWGLPVLTTPVGGIPQVVQHDDNGFLVQPGHVDELAAALRKLLSDSATRVRLGAAARSTIEAHYTLDRALQRLGEIYVRFGVSRLSNDNPT